VELLQRRHWIFDLDGTLTEPVHDFDRLRAELGLPAGVGTLEALQQVPEPRRSELVLRLNQIGWEYALLSKLQVGAREFLDTLVERGCKLGVVTRNNRRNLDESLRLIECEDLFPPEVRLSRDDPPAKPAPDPLLRLLDAWSAPAEDAVMVGDAIYDLQAGRAAGTATLYLDPSGGEGPHGEWADARFSNWLELLPQLAD
jgi:HAD superfamily hydrolase (TIGR01509 family)